MAYRLPSRPSQKDHILVQIETLIQALLQDLTDGQPLFVKLRTSGSSDSVTQRNRNNYCFPGRFSQAAWRFAVILRILDIIHKALVDDTTVSKRDVYYQDPELFESQAVVNKYVDNIALTLEVSREDLNVIADIQGMIAGPILDDREEPSQNNISYMKPEGLTVPRLSQLQHLQVSPNSNPRFLLVVEKRATFHALSRSNFHTRHNCILLTGQGYPDLATRAFLHHFHDLIAPEIPCYALVDFDPDGLSIYSVYTRGSKNLSHENNVCVTELRLLGLKAEDALPLLNTEDVEIISDADSQDVPAHKRSESNSDSALAYLSKRERGRAKGLLKRLSSPDYDVEEDEARQKYMHEKWDWQDSDQQTIAKQETKALIRELQVCLTMGYKVEIQILDRRPGGLEEWILQKVINST